MGEPRFRWCDSKKRIADEQRMRRCKLTMMSTFHNVEEATLGECQKHMGLFVTLTEENLRKLGQEVRDGSSDLRKLPSYAAAMGNGGLMHEVISLMPVLIPEALAIRKDEVRHLIEAAGQSLGDDDEVPGSEETGLFADVFREVTPMREDEVVQGQQTSLVDLIVATEKQ